MSKFKWLAFLFVKNRKELWDVKSIVNYICYCKIFRTYYLVMVDCIISTIYWINTLCIEFHIKHSDFYFKKILIIFHMILRKEENVWPKDYDLTIIKNLNAEQFNILIRKDKLSLRKYNIRAWFVGISVMKNMTATYHHLNPKPNH